MIGDEIVVTEDYYHSKIGLLVTNLDLAVKRLNAKDVALQEQEQKLKGFVELEERVKTLEAEKVAQLAMVKPLPTKEK